MARPPAGPPPVQSSAVVKRDEKPENAKYAQLVRAFDDERRHADLLAMLGSEDALQRFMSVALHAVATNSDLLRKATVASLIQAVKDSAALGLEPTGLTGEAWILIYGDQATLIPGWRGYVKRVRNSGVVQDIDCQIVYMNDDFDLELGTNPQIHHVPKLVGEKDEAGAPIGERGDYRGAYAWARMPSGTYVIEWMTTEDIQYVAQTFSQSFRTGKASPWTTSWPEMARKTVIRRLVKRLPQAAVDLLIAADAKADLLADVSPNGNGNLDVTKARQAAIAAVAGKGAVPLLEAQRPTVVDEAPDAEAQQVDPPVSGAEERRQAYLSQQEAAELATDDLASFDDV